MTFNTDSRVTRTVASTGTVGSTTRYRTVRGGTATARVVTGILLWRRVQRAFATAIQAVRETVTLAGWLLIGACILGLGVGIAFSWIEFIVAGIIAAALLVMSIPFLFGERQYEVEFSLEHDRVVAGQEVRGAITVRNAGTKPALPGRIDLPIGDGIVEIAVPLLRSGAEHSDDIVIPAEKRGIIEVGPARTVRGDPIGILRRERTWDDVFTLYIHPKTTVIPSTSTGYIRDLEGNPSTRIVSDDLSFHAIREYVPGDSRRQVHWKSTAKTGQLMVRQYEETRRSQMVIALATGDDEFRDADEFELAVSAAASIGVRAIRDARDVRFVVGDEIPEFARSSVRSIRELTSLNPRTLLDDLSGVNQSPRVNSLTHIVELAAERSLDASIAFLVCGSTMTARDIRAASLAFPPEISVIVVLCDAHSEPGLRSLADITVLSIGLLEDLRQLLARGAAS